MIDPYFVLVCFSIVCYDNEYVGKHRVSLYTNMPASKSPLGRLHHIHITNYATSPLVSVPNKVYYNVFRPIMEHSPKLNHYFFQASEQFISKHFLKVTSLTKEFLQHSNMATSLGHLHKYSTITLALLHISIFYFTT